MHSLPRPDALRTSIFVFLSLVALMYASIFGNVLGDHPASVLRHRPLPHPDAADQGIHPIPSDPQSAQAEAGGILPTCVVVHQRHRYEYGKNLTLCDDVIVK